VGHLPQNFELIIGPKRSKLGVHFGANASMVLSNA
jgi:hypothetical protein